MKTRTRVLGSIGALLVFGGVTLSVAGPAAADIPSAIAFVDPAPLEASYGSDWVIPISLIGSMYESTATVPLTTEDGSVNITLSGIGGIYAANLPIQPGGAVYFSQPTDQPLLVPGSYQVIASYAPASGSYFDASTTFTPLQFTITQLGVTPRVTAEYEPGAESPVISASLGGAYVEQNGGAPAGTWSFTVTDEHGTNAFETEVAQPAGAAEPIRVEIDSKLSSGYDYTVTSTFTPVEEVSSGLVVDEIPDATFTAPSGSLLEVLGAAAPLPLRLAIPLGVLVLALAVTVIILAIKVRGLTPTGERAPRAKKDRTMVPGDPSDVEIVDMEFVGIEPQRDGPANWSLSAENNPATEVLTEAEPASTPTEQAERDEPSEAPEK